MPGYFITGTDTGVGKTLVTAMLAGLFKDNSISVGVYKPVESGGKMVDGRPASQDMQFVKEKIQLEQPLAEMNSYCFRQAVSPHLAAQLNNQQIDPELIIAHYHYLLTKYRWLLVEGAGGICVPISGTHLLISDLIKAMDLPIIIVARPNLGTINHTVLTAAYAQNLGLKVKGIIFNYCEKTEATIIEETNPGVIREITGLPVLGIIPHLNLAESLSPHQYLDSAQILEV
ncbi:MAG: dethiobiotin synthase [Clostridia bacterium]|nr:dethiobiotin synthase [Clostridia bacterium]